MKKQKNNIAVLHIVGHSGAGKTTLLEKLLPYLKAEGLRVATLKHTHHTVAMDQQGKDSWRHKQAGADTAVLVSAGQWMMVCDTPDHFTPQTWANRYATEHDLLLVEGYHHIQGTKIEVVRAACSSSLRCPASSLLAVVSDVPNLRVDVPILPLNNPKALCRWIMAWLT